MAVETLVSSLIESWGLPALFLGGLVEGDGAGVLGGALAHRGAFPPLAAFAAVTGGAALADQLWFHMARHHRKAPWLRRLVARPAAARLLALAEHRPVLASMAFRFVWGLRTLGPLALGLSAVPARLYVPCSLLAVTAWGALVTALGYGAGHLIERLFGRLETASHLALVLGLMLAALALVALLHHLRRRGAQGG